LTVAAFGATDEVGSKRSRSR